MEITGLLVGARNGDRDSLERLVPLVNDELRRIARARLRNERSGHTLQPTALIHEAYIRLVDTEQRYGHPARRRTGSEGCSPPLCFLCGVLIKCRVFFPHLQINRGRVQGQETARPVLEV